MAEVNAKDLTTKTAPASTDSMLLFGTTTNEGAKITVDNLANNILERLATKTFPNQVGGSSAATILAQLATLNSNLTMPRIVNEPYTLTQANTWEYTGVSFTTTKSGICVVYGGYSNSAVLGLGVSASSTSKAEMRVCSEVSIRTAQTVVFRAEADKTYYVWAKTESAEQNTISVYM